MALRKLYRGANDALGGAHQLRLLSAIALDLELDGLSLVQ
jgi:hypothetical protein